MTDALVRSVSLMGTVVTVHVVGHGATPDERRDREAIVARALEWFREIELRCSRFDSSSDVARVAASLGVPVAVSAAMFEAVRFALAVAEDTGGAFDPTIGAQMEARGFDADYRTGASVRMPVSPARAVSFRDIALDHDRNTITLAHPLVLDLGAVAKGLAIDMAARELAPLRDFAIDAGGDLYLSGHNAEGKSWSVGIRHPREPGALLTTLRVSDAAVCTSGDYERTGDRARRAHHILDPRTGESASDVASATVTAKSAMVADALATAAFVLGPRAGIALLERHGVEGLIVTPSLERHATRGMFRE